MYNMEHIYPRGEHQESGSRRVMSVTANYFKTTFNYQNIFKFQTDIIPRKKFVNLSVSPYLNLLLLTSKRNKFPHTSSNAKMYFSVTDTFARWQ